MGRAVSKLQLSELQRRELERLVHAPSASEREVRRAQIVLGRAGGESQEAVATAIGVNRPVVALWERRFRCQGVAGLADAKGRGRRPSISLERAARVLTEAAQPPPAGHSRWSVRSMARHAQLSPATVQRLWSANGIKPHVLRTLQLSRDRQLVAKFWDVIGLYLHPPDRALVLCCEAKSQCQAPERTQPGQPLGIGHVRTRAHDYLRHGTLTLFAALSYLDGKISSRIAARPTEVEWLAFLRRIDRESPADLTLHLIADGYSTHKHPKVRAWIAKHPRFHTRFAPTSSSWLNLVERSFRDLSEESLRSGSFDSTRELTRAIESYLAECNLDPKPYRWRAKAEDILARIQRARSFAGMPQLSV